MKVWKDIIFDLWEVEAMSKLLHANLIRLKKNKVFWTGIIVIALFCTAICVAMYRDMIRYDEMVNVEMVLFNAITVIGILISVFCSLFVGTEYSDGTIRNKIIIGHSRNTIYLSSFIVCAIAGVVLYIVSLGVSAAIGIPMFGTLQIPFTSFLLLFVDGLLLCIAYAAIYNLVGMLSSNKAYTAIINILLVFTLLFIGIWLYQSLNQPEMMEQAQMIDGQIHLETVQNPNYLTGTRREIYQFFFDCLPGGQSFQISSLEVIHPYLLGICSVIITIVSTIIGMISFKNKNIK